MCADNLLASPALLPHPTLPKYYPDADAKRGFVRDLFNSGADDYDRVERMLALGTGSWYRRQALLRAGLRPGMRVLDVAAGTGLVAREAVAVVGNAQLVIGLDPSVGMLSKAVAALGIPAVLAVGEQIPLARDGVDFVSMGYALRHVSNLPAAFSEFFRVLKPGSTVCLLEITRPSGLLARMLLRIYMKWLIPGLGRFSTRSDDAKRLWRYYWDTIEACVPPAIVMNALRTAGFEQVQRHISLRVFSEYTARKPAGAS